ncbi:MAG TPA: ligase-associated DNA damage response endonuclease PdeM [Burkholderiaceae bacterium]|nr:ligase-associated DNA damage response endonuclease PdeM [Burkholderiaceae bacterium]
MSRVEVGGAVLHLLPEKAAWWPDAATLLVADAHLGKAATFRRLGVPVPEATTAGTLDALDAVLARHAVRRIVFLGDLLHSRHAHSRSTLQTFADWRAQRPALELVLVRGNHDDRAGDPPADWGVRCVDEPFVAAEAAGLALCHHPEPRPGLYVVGGHLHPCVHLGRGFERLRLPCFHFGPAVGVLPAFGTFTGMHPIQRQAGDRVFAVAEERVVALA